MSRPVGTIEFIDMFKFGRILYALTLEVISNCYWK